MKITMLKRGLFPILLITCFVANFTNAQSRKYSCDSFCVESIKMDSVDANEVDVVLHNENATFISFPVIEIIYNGDTVANKKKNFFYYGQAGKSRLTHFLPTTLNSIPANFKCEVLFYGWTGVASKDTCLLTYPCSQSTSVQEVKQQLTASISIYPNPVSSILQIAASDETGQTENVKIYSAIGQNVISQTIPNAGKSILVNVESLQKGIYFLQVTGNSSTYIAKFVKD
jgi:hypothetical protein